MVSFFLSLPPPIFVSFLPQFSFFILSFSVVYSFQIFLPSCRFVCFSYLFSFIFLSSSQILSFFYFLSSILFLFCFLSFVISSSVYFCCLPLSSFILSFSFCHCPLQIMSSALLIGSIRRDTTLCKYKWSEPLDLAFQQDHDPLITLLDWLCVLFCIQSSVPNIPPRLLQPEAHCHDLLLKYSLHQTLFQHSVNLCECLYKFSVHICINCCCFLRHIFRECCLSTALANTSCSSRYHLPCMYLIITVRNL